MKILVTGGTGFVGRAFCKLAVERGHDVLALCRQNDQTLPPEVKVVVGTLLETPWDSVERFSPESVLHLAWVATPGLYLTSPDNDQWLANSKAWFSQLIKMGIPHIAGVGTCIEYAASTNPLQELGAPLAPLYPYSRAKASLYQWLNEHTIDSKVWSWLRIFYPYGPGEHPNRISTSLIQQLSKGQTLSLRTPYSVKDYIYIDDLATALCVSLETRLTGPVNLGSGSGISILELAKKIARMVSADPDLVRVAPELSDDPTPTMIASTDKLVNVGWAPVTSLERGLQNLHERLLRPPTHFKNCPPHPD